MMRRLLVIVWLVAAAAAPVLAMQPPAAQSEYVPVKDLPPVDQLPAAPLLVAAYSFIWLVAMFYLWTIWRRLNKVETEMRALEQRQHRGAGR
jgi:CcmD family protein